MGFKEFRTAAIAAGHLDRLGIPHETGLAITGVRGLLKAKSSDITAAYLGELDSVLVRGHPDADPETGAAHAGGSPHNGVNALKAATLALQAIDASRETFKDDDHIRVHPIITKGGELVNVIPADVHIETLAGYLPRILNQGLVDAYRRNAVEIVSHDEWWEPTFRAGRFQAGNE